MTARHLAWVLAACFIVIVLVAHAQADERTVWKYDKGTFEKVGDGKWVHKTGDKTHDLTEKTVKDDYIELQDKGGKEIVKITKDGATIRAAGKTGLTRLKGEWVDATAQKKKEADSKTDTKDKADPKADAKYVEVAAFKRDGQQGVYGIAPSPDGKRVAMMHGPFGNPQFGVLDVTNGKSEKSWKLYGTVDKVAWSADGKTLAALMLGEPKMGGKPSQVLVWETATWESKAEFDVAGFPGTFALSADGNVVATATSNDNDGNGAAKVWDVGAKKEIFSQKTKAFTTKIGMSADGKLLAVSNVGLFDLPGGKPRAAPKIGPDFILSADGNTLVEWAYGNDGLVINVSNTKAPTAAPRVIKGGKWKADTVVFLDKDRHLAVGGGMGQDEVRVFELKTLKEVDSFKVGKPLKSGGRVYLHLRPTADSAHLLTYGSDFFVRMWTTPFGEKKDAPTPKEKKD